MATNSASAQAIQPAPAAPGTSPATTATSAERTTRDKDNKSADGVVNLDKVVVSDKKDVLQPNTLHGAEQDLGKIAGGVGIIDQTDFLGGRIGTNADILAYQPGVFAQAAEGNDAIKISIRGSGINTGAGGAFRGGVYFLFDGLPVTGPGGAPYEFFEAQGLNYTEVLKGANGFKVGSTFLGGAINYVTKTGYDAPTLGIRFEAGSFGYAKGQIESGRVIGKFDYYTSVTKSILQGFRDDTQARSDGVAANFGYRISSTISNRFFIRYRHVENESGNGSLSRDEIRQDATQNSPVRNPDPFIRSISTRVQPGSKQIGDKISFQLTPDSKLEVGIVTQDYPISQRSFTAAAAVNNVAYPTNDVPGTATSPLIRAGSLVPAYPKGYYGYTYWTFQDLGGLVNYDRKDTILGHEVSTVVGLHTTTHLDAGLDNYRYDPDTWTKTRISGRFNNGSSDDVVFGAVDVKAANDLTLIAGATGAHFRRTQQWTYPITPETGPNFVKETYHLLGRGGFLWQPKPNFAVYGNISESVEPPEAWNFSGSTPGVADKFQFTRAISGTTGASSATNYANMKAISYELGVRGQFSIFQGSLTFFRSRVKDELISIVAYNVGDLNPNYPTTTPQYFDAVQTQQFNASPTIKQGVELGFDATLWEDRSASTATSAGGNKAGKSSIIFRNSFTYNDFHYENDKFYSKNELPGVPKFFYQGQLIFNHSSGIFGAVSTQVSSAYPVTFWNTPSQYADAYRIYGANIGYRPPGGRWSLSFDFRNITDVNYSGSAGPSASTVTATSGTTALRVYRPGEPFGVTAIFTFAY